MSDFNKMLADLSPKKKVITIKGHDFFARPMTVTEFSEFYYKNLEVSDRNDNMILACIVDKDNNCVFESIEQVQSLYTSVRAELANAVSKASILAIKVDELEKK